jgi:hypothetical protein
MAALARGIFAVHSENNPGDQTAVMPDFSKNLDLPQAR